MLMQDHAFRDNVTSRHSTPLGVGRLENGSAPRLYVGFQFRRDNNALTAYPADRLGMESLPHQCLHNDGRENGGVRRTGATPEPRILFGYASSLHRFAQFVRQGPYQGIRFDGIISSAEVLPEAVRQVIEETFKCRVFNRYGTKDLGGIACECEAHSGLHVSAENNLIEILCDDRPTRPGETGSIIVTNLNNWGMPFIRYSIGDEGAWDDDSRCPCGRSSPRLKAVDGRIVDRFVTRDGRASWAGFAGDGYSLLFAQPTIKQFQIIQESLDKITVLLVKEGEIPASLLHRIELTLQTAFGDDIVVEFEFPDKILPLPSGKHQYAISRVAEFSGNRTQGGCPNRNLSALIMI